MKAIANTAVKTYTEGTLTHIPLSRIVDHEEIPYRELNETWVKELSANIEEVGMQSPLLIWNGGGEKGQRMVIGDGGEKVPASFLVAGSHRRAALKALQKRNLARFKEQFPNGVPVFVIGGELPEVLSAHLRENVMREDMTNEQIFPVLERLTTSEKKGGFGLSQKEVAKRIGKSTAWVSQVLDIKEHLGEEGVEALKKGELGLAAARDVASKVKKDKKAGKPVDNKAELKKAKEKAAARKAAGKQRNERRLSAKALYKRYLTLPKMGMGDKISILEAVLGYLAGDENVQLPEELTAEAEENSDKDESEE